MCGEKISAAPMSCFARGSPPRVRGKDLRRCDCLRAVRITPACAGKSEILVCKVASRRDHPRVCGEKVHVLDRHGLGVGSPPRVRGKDYSVVFDRLKARITPACAGKSIFRAGTSGPGRDHPRVCGEKPYPAAGRNTGDGSPPRVRGKGSVPGCCRQARRITPACAGKSRSGARSQPAGRDHPRVCGEKYRIAQGRLNTAGSPPRVRGKERWRYRCGRHKGITPACAGKSLVRVVCDKPNIGSPPRVRGKELVVFPEPDSPRITPACAGKSAMPSTLRAYRQDHPRVCGEKRSRKTCLAFTNGSPPRVRGKAAGRFSWAARPRITPACAGKRPGLQRWRSGPRDHPRVCGEKDLMCRPLYHAWGSPPRVRGKVSL